MFLPLNFIDINKIPTEASYNITKNFHYFLIRKLKRKQPYLFTLDKREEKQMDFDWNGLLDQFQPSQRVCTPCKRCNIDAQEKLFVLTTFSRFIGLCRVCVMQYMELSDKKLIRPGPSKISVHSGVTLFMFFVCVRVCVYMCIYMCV